MSYLEKEGRGGQRRIWRTKKTVSWEPGAECLRRKGMVFEPNAAAICRQMDMPSERHGLGLVAGAALEEYWGQKPDDSELKSK